MGFLNSIFGGGTPAEKAARLKPKATQKYGDPTTRQKALQQLGEIKHADAVPVMMARFTFNVDPQTTDAEEKQHIFESIVELEKDSVQPVRDFLKKSDQSSSWALKILSALLTEDEVIGIATEELQRLGASYTRDPEKKEVLLHFVEGKNDARVGPVLVPLLNDMSDDVKMAALKTLASVKYEPARDAVLELLTSDETGKRVQTSCMNLLASTGWQIQGFREKVEKRLGDGFTLDKAGTVKKRGA
jgi:hypothetical protein